MQYCYASRAFFGIETYIREPVRILHKIFKQKQIAQIQKL